MRLKTLADGKVGVQVYLVQTNDHLCSLSGVGELIEGKVVFRGRPEEYPEGCTLSIEIRPDRFVLHDDGQRCRAYACGARAALDGVEFLRMNREEYGPACGEDR